MIIARLFDFLAHTFLHAHIRYLKKQTVHHVKFCFIFLYFLITLHLFTLGASTLDPPGWVIKSLLSYPIIRSKRSSAKLLLKDLHWLPVKDRIIYKIAVLVFNIINNNSSPSYLREIITVYTPQTQRSLRSSQKSLLEVPRKNLKTFGERSFSNAAPEVWNKLPEYIKSSQSTAIFKKNLKTYLFCCSFETM